MRETARDSVAACAITVLKAIRTVTKVAKLSSIKVDVKVDMTLQPSWATFSGRKVLCVRYRGSIPVRVKGDEKLVSVGRPEHISTWFVYRFTDNLSSTLKKYLIIAPDIASAKAKAKSIVRARQIRFAGLARRAISVLMMKTATKKVNDNVPMRVSAKAREVTSTKEVIAKAKDGNGGKYSLTMHDELKYAIDAIKGGRMTVDTQLKKAMNKMVSVINKKMPDGSSFFGKKKLPTPFPELVRKRK